MGVDAFEPTRARTRRQPGSARSPLVGDLLFYFGCLVYAVVIAYASEFYGFRMWGAFAAIGYGIAGVHTIWLATRSRRPGWLYSRRVGLAAVGVFGMLLPLGFLVIRRLTGVDWLITPFSWSAQPEVWVIERSASLLLHHGTPYVDITALGRPPEVNDYTPYGPVMSVFGLPRALFGGTPAGDALTDARLMFAITAVVCVWVTLRLMGRPRVPVRAAQLAMACPLTALTWSVAGPDLAIVGLMLVAGALAARDRPVASAILLALVLSAKLIVAPAAVVLAVLVATRLGGRALTRFLATLVAACALLNVPVLLVDPSAFVEHVIRFPAGLGVVTSPAASPLPGYLIASTGPVGQAAAFTLLGAAAIAILWWLLRRPPVTGSDAMLRIAVGLGAFTLLTPATRYGYLVYPLVLLAAMLCFRRAESETPSPGTTSS
ncbi:glycosyltransferase 87 family protein [Amycolatopsis sp.]|uniref:glycosyltransferase 87 family protein n=1 Tax=Amycolatopsis sp. TaxID=37632 RepID=UPI002B9EB004|nr:glycosyltransferase 87 family protein [Amycolatopsis sp.]HVV09587.1 glycosyltransferase 87 family protein [Amycolatopsis sp.]